MEEIVVNLKIVVFTFYGNKLQIFLPNKKLPTAKFNNKLTLDKVALNLFQNKLGKSYGYFYLEQLYTFLKNSQVPEGIDIVYYILIPKFTLKPYVDSEWVDIKNKNFFTQNDREIINYSIQRLRWKVEYTNIVYSLLPEEFTFSELQNIYEVILGKKLDKRNFRKKILSLKILSHTGKKKRLGKARPAEMFKFQKKELTYVKIL